MRVASCANWLFVACAGAIDAPTNGPSGIAKVDLVFPRNETYAASQDLPIVFAFQNSKLAPYLNPYIDYAIYPLYQADKIVARGIYELGRANFSSEDPYFEYQRSFQLDTEGVWGMRWSLEWSSCVSHNKGEWYSAAYNRTYRWITFTTIKKPTQDLDLVAATEKTNCSRNMEETGIAINITNNVGVGGYTSQHKAKTCAVVPYNISATDPCQVQIGSTTASKISASMAYRQCRFTASPTTACRPDEESVAHRSAVGAVTLVAVTVGALGFLLK